MKSNVLVPGGIDLSVGSINRLRPSGRKAVRGGKVSQPFFSVGDCIIIVDGEQVQVFQYASAKRWSGK